MDSHDNRETLALARRYYLHLKSGAQITADDMGRIVEGMEEYDAEIERLLRKDADALATIEKADSFAREVRAGMKRAWNAYERYSKFRRKKGGVMPRFEKAVGDDNA